MNVKISVAAAIAVMAGLLTGCSGDDDSITPPSSVAPSTETALGDAPGTTPAGVGNGLCLDPRSKLVTSAIADLKPAPVDETSWIIAEASEDPIADGCDDLLSYVAVEWNGMHPATHILFFTDGRYLGTGSEDPYAYTTITDNSRTTVSAEYRWPLEDDPLCCPQGGPNLVVYTLSLDGELTVNGEFPPN